MSAEKKLALFCFIINGALKRPVFTHLLPLRDGGWERIRWVRNAHPTLMRPLPPTSSLPAQVLHDPGHGGDVLVAPALADAQAVEMQQHLPQGHRRLRYSLRFLPFQA